ncbi:hypothetical protein [Stagnihabitans tardus]|uniref:Uncharacterized protein n=1 Tax=Stagnihabitans tardus TaxID=2699202 RepID=A0AAE4YCU2_9RHOB|nr:hypothetical protein [Stagnihabitans tardus]NBZ87610.1 hypothetical protein [Stagnihabitans tardus]
MDAILRMIFNRLIGLVMSRGIDHLARGGRDPSQMSREERQQYRAAKQNGRRARQAASIARRFLK